MGFLIYDLAFLIVFTLGVVVFLYTRKHNLKRQGILYLYRTQLGIKFIDRFAIRFRKILKPMQYVVIASGYILMGTVMWMIIRTTHLYLTTEVSQLIKAPPIAPLIPYFPKLFGLESLFPPLPFTVFIVALAIVAVTHEFSHGIFARLNNFKIHSTGFAFMGPFLGAFVEPDEKQMSKAKKFPQLSILAAGTFANVLMTILFGLIMWLFFTSFFTPAGVNSYVYSVSEINIADIVSEGDEVVYTKYIEIEISERNEVIPPDDFQLGPEENEKYYIEKAGLERAREIGQEKVIVFDDMPAFRAQMQGAITEIDGMKIRDPGDISLALENSKPGEEVKVNTVILNPGQGTVAEYNEYSIVLDENEGKAVLGIWLLDRQPEGFVGYIYKHTFAKMKNPILFYESSLGDLGWFVYYMLWWIVIINILVALFNMLPLGILDGGRFFYLTVWGITGSEKWGRKSFAFATWFLLALLGILMLKWIAGFF